MSRNTPPPPMPPPPPPPPGSYPTGPVGPQWQNGSGTTALVTGILSFALCPIILSIVAIVAGNRGEKLAAQGLANNGETARWGKILGWVSLIAYTVMAFSLSIFGVIVRNN